MTAERIYTLTKAIRNAAALWPNKTWLDFSGEKHSFADVDQASTQLAHGLSDLGVKRGDRVCSILDNNVDCVLLWLALSKLGAVSVPINTAFRGEFLRHQIADAGAEIVVAETHYLPNLAAIADQLSDVRTVVVRGEEEESTDSRTGKETMALKDVFSERTEAIDCEVGPYDLCALFYTSGTTGPSKGCMIGHKFILNNGWQASRCLGVRHEDVYWTPCPLFHAGAAAALIGTLQSGTTLSVAPQFSLSGFWPEIERSKATVVLLISFPLSYVANAPDCEIAKRCFGQIRTIHGVPFNGELQEKWKTRFGVTNAGAVGYGLTETSSLTLAKLEEAAPPGSSGRRNDDFDVEIVDDDDNILPAGKPGQIVARPRQPGVLFQGYWKRPEATLEVTRNLWFHTGDIGRFDEEGYFYFVDRKKDYLRRGGENISSHEMEVTFRAHPDVEDLAVHAVPSETAEDEVKLTVIKRAGSELSAEELCRWSIDRLPTFAVPRFIEFREDLPRTATGRVQKYLLRAEGVTPGTWDREKSELRRVNKRERAAALQ